MAAQFGLSHCENVTSPAPVTVNPPSCLIASSPSNKSNPNRSPPTTRTSIAKGGFAPILTCTTLIPQHVSAAPSAVSTWIVFFIYAQQHDLWTSDCIHPVSMWVCLPPLWAHKLFSSSMPNSTTYGLVTAYILCPLCMMFHQCETVTTSSVPFTRFWGMRLALNSHPLAHFPGNIEQCAHAADINNTRQFFKAWH